MDLSLLSSSPQSVVPRILSSNSNKKEAASLNFSSGPLTLDEFCRLLPETFQEHTRLIHENESDDNVIAKLFGRLALEKEEWNRFAFFDKSKNYTRNLVATDSKSFTLILLCWNPNRESPIHDHPCDGCWMRVLQGNVTEARYVKNEADDSLKCTSDKLYKEGQQAYIEDSMGYHKVGNPSCTVPAVTLHLYCPPFQKCKIWLNSSCKASKPSTSCVCYYSEYGRNRTVG